jgi:hypothetical protein
MVPEGQDFIECVEVGKINARDVGRDAPRAWHVAGLARSRSRLRWSFCSAARGIHGARDRGVSLISARAWGYETSMLSKPLLAIILTACGVNSSGATTDPPTEQPDVQPPDDINKDNVYFCCLDVEKKTGDGCVTIGEKEIDRCDTVLACAEGFNKEDGKVTCF